MSRSAWSIQCVSTGRDVGYDIQHPCISFRRRGGRCTKRRSELVQYALSMPSLFSYVCYASSTSNGSHFPAKGGCTLIACKVLFYVSDMPHTVSR